MKVYAYAKKSNEYILDPVKKRKRRFSIIEALEMKRIHKDEHYARSLESKPDFRFEEVSFWSGATQGQAEGQLSPVNRGFYRYHPGQGPEKIGGDGESLSHQLAIFAMSELKSIPFHCCKSILNLEFDSFDIDGEETRLQLGRGANERYYPDLIGYLTPASDNYEKWGGKVLIEIEVTHGYKSTDPRIELFQRHSFAVIQVKIGHELMYAPERDKCMSGSNHNLVNQHIEFLKNEFSSGVNAELLSDPMETEFAQGRFNELLKYYQEQSNKLETAEKTIRSKKAQINRLKDDLDNAEKQHQNTKNAHVASWKEAQNDHKSEVKMLTDAYNSELAKNGIVIGISASVLVCAIVIPAMFPSGAIDLLNGYFKTVFSIHNTIKDLI